MILQGVLNYVPRIHAERATGKRRDDKADVTNWLSFWQTCKPPENVPPDVRECFYECYDYLEGIIRGILTLRRIEQEHGKQREQAKKRLRIYANVTVVCGICIPLFEVGRHVGVALPAPSSMPYITSAAITSAGVAILGMINALVGFKQKREPYVYKTESFTAILTERRNTFDTLKRQLVHYNPRDDRDRYTLSNLKLKIALLIDEIKKDYDRGILVLEDLTVDEWGRASLERETWFAILTKHDWQNA